jgi:glucuronate isomerase
MRPFLGEDFLLSTRASRRLYHGHAESAPIIDFHCHLPPGEIAENKAFRSLTEAWLGDDHYKWRAMRASGVAERLITGDAPDRDKFLAWASVAPSTVGNPLYHWTHLEMKRYFGIAGKLLSASTGPEIYDRCTALLQQDGWRVRGLIRRMNVQVACTTDDPVDSLAHHAAIRADASFPVKVCPTFRPDAALAADRPAAFAAWVAKLAAAAGMPVTDWASLLAALRKRHAFFHDAGCRASDHGIEEAFADDCSEEEADAVVRAALAGQAVDPSRVRAYKSALMRELGRMDADRGWVMQLHLGALRDINSRFFAARGPNTGFDTIGDWPLARALARFLDSLDREGRLPKTILYCLNPSDYAVLATVAGGFPQEGVRGKMQFGPAWWFNDQKHGMEQQLQVLADVGLLPRFVGMLTDSRSYLSYPRHEYFRRLLCEMLGTAMERGEAPADWTLMGGIVEDICHRNAREYFGF